MGEHRYIKIGKRRIPGDATVKKHRIHRREKRSRLVPGMGKGGHLKAAAAGIIASVGTVKEGGAKIGEHAEGERTIRHLRGIGKGK